MSDTLDLIVSKLKFEKIIYRKFKYTLDFGVQNITITFGDN